MTKNTKGIIAYLFIAFGMAWLCWEIPIRLGVSVHSPLFQLAALPGGFAPAIAAIVVRKWITREGFADAGLRLHLRKWPYYLAAWLIPLAVVGFLIVAAYALKIGQPDFTLIRAIKSLLPAGVTLPPTVHPKFSGAILGVLITAIMVTPVLWGEEFGWRSYLQLRLCPGRPLRAAIFTGLIWGAWHFPLVVRGYAYPHSSQWGLLVFPVSTVLLSVILGWLRQRTGSVWAPSLAHAATNVIGGQLTFVLFSGGANLLLVSNLGVLAWIPLGALCAWIVVTGQLQPSTERAQPIGRYAL
jgi:membrane protease YdiL (CAAX protease family)